MIIKTINPATEVVLQEYSTLSEKQMDTLIDAGHLTFNIWKKTTFLQRKQAMLKMAALLRQKKNDFALLIANEMGKHY